LGQQFDAVGQHRAGLVGQYFYRFNCLLHVKKWSGGRKYRIRHLAVSMPGLFLHSK
jgi:hypothetical protein